MRRRKWRRRGRPAAATSQERSGIITIGTSTRLARFTNTPRASAFTRRWAQIDRRPDRNAGLSGGRMGQYFPGPDSIHRALPAAHERARPRPVRIAVSARRDVGGTAGCAGGLGCARARDHTPPTPNGRGYGYLGGRTAEPAEVSGAGKGLGPCRPEPSSRAWRGRADGLRHPEGGPGGRQPGGPGPASAGANCCRKRGSGAVDPARGGLRAVVGQTPHAMQAANTRA